MSFSKKIFEKRKEKNITREKLAKLIDTSGAIIGMYERDERTPSVEIARKIAINLDISLDYLTGIIDSPLDKKIIKRILDIQKLNKESQNVLFNIIDAYLRDAKTRSAYEIE